MFDRLKHKRLAAIAASHSAIERTSRHVATLISRWDALIIDNHTRFSRLLEEAAAASEPLVHAIQSDLIPLILPWKASAPRLRDACDEVCEFWTAISDDMAHCRGFSHDMLAREGDKRDIATDELELVHDRVYGGVMARAADRMRQVALGIDAAARLCVHCGATLNNAAPVPQSLQVECAVCQSLNPVEPGMALRKFTATGAMFLVAEEARAAGEAMKRLERHIGQYRDANAIPLDRLVEFETVSRNYWTTRLAAEARYNRNDPVQLPAKLDRHMKDVHKRLRRYGQWRDYETERQTE